MPDIKSVILSHFYTMVHYTCMFLQVSSLISDHLLREITFPKLLHYTVTRELQGGPDRHSKGLPGCASCTDWRMYVFTFARNEFEVHLRNIFQQTQIKRLKIQNKRLSQSVFFILFFFRELLVPRKRYLKRLIMRKVKKTGKMKQINFMSGLRNYLLTI